MEHHALPRTLIPRRLYRVQYEDAHTQETEFGLTASNLSHFDYSDDAFAQTLEAHLVGDDFDSPLISCFSEKNQAEEWMCRNWRTLGGWAQILEIDTQYLGHGYVFRASRVAVDLGLTVWTEDNHDDIVGEILILHHIKARAIIARRARVSVSQLREDQSVAVDPPVWTNAYGHETLFTPSISSRTSSISRGFDRDSLIHYNPECASPGTGSYASRSPMSRGYMPRRTAPGRVNITSSDCCTVSGDDSSRYSSQRGSFSTFSQTASTARSRSSSVQSSSATDSDVHSDGELTPRR